MIDMGSLGEIFIIFIAALILIGPKEMPQVLRALGRWIHKLQSLSLHVRQEIDQYIQEGKIEEYEKSVKPQKPPTTSKISGSSPSENFSSPEDLPHE